ncbi:MAG: type II toxin-antitoxin system RelE/ParE family toxin [Oryzomonas sp.]|uniref:type II toxin-antitoxin system RelE family toxin n=1 Tax=Oryzomonas sp. TaxID=2855186 RepID=UPI002842D599|nr:type II toxin-antitoxin system RelE/ParE family toxin [Oryzomonas sp.]MDR3578566.1 type II toxin-antitoxin system RelE/ParE family toxin [Oryzomonas sp.]
MYQIEYQQQAIKTLLKMPRDPARLIRAKIELLAKSPYSANNNVKKLEGIGGYRLRIGDWRVLYDIIDDRLIIVVVKIKPRGDAYK